MFVCITKLHVDEMCRELRKKSGFSALCNIETCETLPNITSKGREKRKVSQLFRQHLVQYFAKSSRDWTRNTCRKKFVARKLNVVLILWCLNYFWGSFWNRSENWNPRIQNNFSKIVWWIITVETFRHLGQLFWVIIQWHQILVLPITAFQWIYTSLKASLTTGDFEPSETITTQIAMIAYKCNNNSSIDCDQNARWFIFEFAFYWFLSCHSPAGWVWNERNFAVWLCIDRIEKLLNDNVGH